MKLCYLDAFSGISGDMLVGALADAIARANEDDAIRALLIQADGDLFTAGNDVSEFAAQAMGNAPEERHVLRFLRALATATVIDFYRRLVRPGASDAHYLRVYMKQLRDKLEADPVQPKYLLTDTGVGYRLVAEEP